MSLNRYPGNIILTILILLVGSPATAQQEVGSVMAVESHAWVERDGGKSEIIVTNKVKLGDTLFVKRRPVSHKLTLLFENDDGQEFGSIELMRGGKVRLFGDDGSGVKCDFVSGGHLIDGRPCEGIYEDGILIVTNTIYEVDILPNSTRLFVYEGSVSVLSTNSEYPEPRHVHAGEWLRFRKDEPIPKPQRFTMAIGPGSGSTECIYSDCKLVNSVLIPERPAVTPSVLLPPDPNPPGQR